MEIIQVNFKFALISSKTVQWCIAAINQFIYLCLKRTAHALVLKRLIFSPFYDHFGIEKSALSKKTSHDFKQACLSKNLQLANLIPKLDHRWPQDLLATRSFSLWPKDSTWGQAFFNELFFFPLEGSWPRYVKKSFCLHLTGG